MPLIPSRRPLTLEEHDAALLDPTIFIDHHCWIRAKGGATERFHLWPEQIECVEAFDDTDDVIVLKARQLGLSWCADAYALWLCTANQGQTVLIFSLGQREADAELERVRFMYDRLPSELQLRLGTQVPGSREKDNMSQISFPDMDSRIISMPATRDAGTSFTATLVIVQELAKITFASSLMAGIIPTIADGGRMLVVSTAKGFSGAFYDLWRANQDRLRESRVVGDKPTGEGGFRPVFIPWSAHPNRDQAWYDRRSQQMSDQEMRQEFPSSPSEAFQGSADAVFSEEFDRRVHAIPQSRERSNVFEVVHGVDPGVNHGLAYLIEVQGRMAFVFAEVHLENCSVQELGMAVAAMDRYQGLDPADVMTYMDPFDVGRNAHTLQTDLDVLAEQGLLVDREAQRYSPAQRTSLFKVLLKNERLWISQDCPLLIDALERAEWKTHRAPNGETVRDDTYAKDSRHEHCLAKGTLVTTRRGDVPIESVRVGDLALTHVGWRPVVASGLTQSRAETLRVCCDDGSVLVGTGNHRIWVDGGWMRLDAVRPYARLLSVSLGARRSRVHRGDGHVIRVESISAGVPGPVYDLTVSGAHEFFANGILVHNCLDAAGTALARVFPPIAPAAADTMAGDLMAARQYLYSGSEYG